MALDSNMSLINSLIKLKKHGITFLISFYLMGFTLKQRVICALKTVRNSF